MFFQCLLFCPKNKQTKTKEPSPGDFNYFIQYQYQYLYCFTFTPGNSTQYTVAHSTTGHLIADIRLLSISFTQFSEYVLMALNHP